MKKRLLSLFLTLILALGAFPTFAAAADINGSGVFAQQQGRSTCTLASTAMMLRRKAIVDADADWASITESSVRKVAWSGGLAWNFTYKGMHVSVMRRNSGWAGSSLASKRQALIDLLAAHPEGVVAYATSQPHAVLLTDYDANTGTFYCCDPAPYYCCGRTPLTNSSLRGGSQDGILKNINQLWYVASGVSSGAGTDAAAVAAKAAAEAAKAAAEAAAKAAEEPVVEEPPMAREATKTVQINDKSVQLNMYALTDENGNDVNYVMLRDLAQALVGTPAQFNVGYNGKVTLTTRIPYLSLDSADSPFSGDQPYTAPETETLVDDEPTKLDVIQLTDEQGGGYLFYNLRDLGDVLGYEVNWDARAGICLNTKTAL